MTDFSNYNIMNTEPKQPGKYVYERFIDIHCHCLAGLDDGPSGISQSMTLCKELVRENIAAVIATPHQLGSYDGLNEAQTIRDAVIKHNEILKKEGIPIKIFPGGEVRVDERICRLLEDDKILTLADNERYILLELPHLVFIDIEPILRDLVSMNIFPIISHAERIETFIKKPNILFKWLKHPIILQITASSLLGGFGKAVEKTAWDFLNYGFACIVASDSHNTNSRRPMLKAAYKLIAFRLGKRAAYRVCIENPLKVIKGKEIPHNQLFEKQEVIS